MNELPPFSTLPVTHNSALVGPGTIFFALQGARTHGAHYIPEAVARGTREIVIEQGYQLPPSLQELCAARGVSIRSSATIRAELARCAAAAHHHPAQSLLCIGITGTKGKSTTSFLLHHILQHTSHQTGLLSTVGNRIGTHSYPAELTTPHADYLHAFLNACRMQGSTHMVIEVAAQAVTLQRTAGIPFAAVAWLNFSQEHGEFYDTQEAYWHAKRQLMSQVIPTGFILLPDNAPWKHPCVPSSTPSVCCTQAHWHPTEYYFAPPYQPPAARSDLKERAIACTYEGVEYRCPQLIGSYNSANLLVAVMIARKFSVAPHAIQGALNLFDGIPGRLQWYPLRSGAYGCIDYAHNPASFEAVLSTLRTQTEQLIVICGAGGDRDPSRRPAMGALAARYADMLFLTTDNPRSEDPATICAQMYEGVAPLDRPKVTIELDRKAAILTAGTLAQPGGIIALLGKGPDEYQLIQGVRHPFSEREILSNL